MQGYTTIEKPQKELTFQDIVNILKKYKWSIITITTLFAFLSYAYIYFKPSSYISYSIIKVKANEKTRSEDIINSTISTVRSKDVLEEISLLRTYKINSKSLDNVNFKTQFYVDEGYRKKEIYGDDVPIDISDIRIFNKNIIGQRLTLIPTKSGFNIKYIMPYKAKLKQAIFQTKEFYLDPIKNKHYSQTIEHKDFKFKITQKSKFTTPIHFIIHGDKRSIFERLIYYKLNIQPLEKDTSLIKISFEDTIPERANLYVDALTKSFIDYSIESKNTQNDKTLNFIVTELRNIKRELKNSEEKLEFHQVSKNIAKPSEQATLYIKNLSNIDIEISENNLKKKLILNLISFVQNNYNLDAIAPSISKLDDKNTFELITKLQNNQIIEEELSQEYTDEYPKLKTLKKTIATIRNKIEYNLKSLRNNIDYENTNLLKRKVSYETKMKTLPSKERELVNIKRNYEVKSKMYEYLLKKEAENKIVQLATFSDYQIIDNAYNSNVPVKPNKSFILLVSILLGLAVSSLIAFIRHFSNNYITNKEDIEFVTNLPIYGSIPFHKQGKNQIEVHKEAKSPYSESFRTLRTNLQFLSQKERGTVILITSTVPGEGKSTTSANLATILEMAKYKTVVINFDLRKPTLHNFFEVNNERGISSFLNGDNTITEVIEQTEFANLDIIPSGPIPENPSELMLSKQLPLLFQQLRSMYDYIIVDTAPIGIVSDTKTLMPLSDLNLIIVREGYAKKEFIHTLEEMIQKHNFKDVGLILNASKAQGGEYGYGYSYEYKYQ
jgi:capsular exopolysaccharide synthesis family protein